ncbi:MAG: GNAT family N-acetyltransferase [Bacteroidota bacterium]
MINEIYFKDFQRLESDRLLLRNLELSDAPEIQLIRSDEKVMIYMDSKRQLTIQHSENFISDNLKMYEEKTGIFWAIIEKSTNTFIGDFAFFKIDHKNSRAEIGYALKPEFWGMGFMKETMLNIFNFGFNDLNLHSLEANINPNNNKSRAILKKMGFQKEAYFRENYYYNGDYLDSEIYSLLKSEFQTGKKNKE